MREAAQQKATADQTHSVMLTSKQGNLRYWIPSHILGSRTYLCSNDKQGRVHQQSWELRKTNSLELKLSIKKKNTSRFCISRKIDFSGVNKMWNKYTLIQCLILSSRHTSLIMPELSLWRSLCCFHQFSICSFETIQCQVSAELQKLQARAKYVNREGTHEGGRMQRNKLKDTQNRLSALICLWAYQWRTITLPRVGIGNTVRHDST